MTTFAVTRPALGGLPGAQGFLAPAEESPHARTWMCWASTAEIYGDDTAYFESVQEHLGRLAAAIAKHEPVTMLAAAAHHERARALCGPKVTLVDLATDDMWARDSGPVFLRSGKGETAVLGLNFNGWGGKQRHDHDQKVAESVAAEVGCRYFQAKITGEGGGIEYDGEGTLILTDSCWLNDNRNPGWSRDELEQALKGYLGVEKVIWVPGVRGKDITDGHIDGSIRVVRPGLLMTSGYPGDTSEWAIALKEAKAILAKATDAKGRSFELVEVLSAVDVRSQEEGFFTSYANYYVGNGALYSPTFGDAKADQRALDSFSKLFPGREIVMLDVDRIYENGGGIHCVTQQQPT
jgi:agmatine deiminase